MTQMVAYTMGKRLDADVTEQNDALLEETKRQIDEYLAGSRRAFDVPLLLVGTDFQRNVWNALLQVPYGATASYLQIARAIGKEKAVRAVGNACRANPIGIIVPCHRIIGSDGSLVGYYGGLSLKRRLLNLERGHTPEFQG
jgi:methylated-DNA-[protein]-cysteine S-methyltransferase